MERKLVLKLQNWGGRVNSNDKVDTVHAMKECKGIEVELQSFLTTTKNGGDWPTISPGRFIPGNYWIRGYKEGEGAETV